MQVRLKRPAKLLLDAFPLLIQLNESARRALPAPARDLALVRLGAPLAAAAAKSPQSQGVLSWSTVSA